MRPITRFLVGSVATLFVAWLSEFLVTSVESARAQLGVTEVFIGVIIVAIIGNAAEHSTAVWMAINLIAGVTGMGVGGEAGLIAWQAHLGGYLAGLFLAGPFDRLRPKVSMI